MGANKVSFNTPNGEQVIIDLTGDNVTPDSLVVGHTAHGADGEPVQGANPYELEATNTEVGSQTSLIAQIAQALEGKAAGGAEPIIEPLSITENGTYTAPDGVHGYSPVTVNVKSGGSNLTDNTAALEEILAAVNALPEAGSGEISLQEKTVTPTKSAQEIVADSGYDGLSKVNVEKIPDPVLQSKTVSPSTIDQTVKFDSGYDGLSDVTVRAMAQVARGTPYVKVDANGLITAAVSQSTGYVKGGTTSATKQLDTQAAQTITPGTTDQTIASGKYLIGTQTIEGDENLVPENIASGVTIFGVEGTMESGGSQNVVDETVTIASACTNAEQVYNLLASLVAPNASVASIEWIGDIPPTKNNQFLWALLSFRGNAQSNPNFRMIYTRWRDGAFNNPDNSGSLYDTVLSVGDRVRVVASV